MTEQGVIVIIGSPTALPDTSGVHQAGGLAIRVAAELVRRGERVELVGRVGAMRRAIRRSSPSRATGSVMLRCCATPHW